jgi:hypothetical protein
VSGLHDEGQFSFFETQEADLFSPTRLMDNRLIVCGGDQDMDAGKIGILGIDNVVFEVAELDAAILFYERCGFVLKLRMQDKQMALFDIGHESPGLILRVDGCSPGGRLWVEVRDAEQVRQSLIDVGMEPVRIETATGITCEIDDPFGNRLGFADYSKMPQLTRR